MPDSFADYRAIEAVNWSTLKEMGKSPAHYQHRLTHPLMDTPRLLLGRAVHTAVLEPDMFALQYTVYDGKTRYGKEWDAFRAANADKGILKFDEYRTCLNIRDAVYANKTAAALLTGGESEVTVEWVDKGTGIKCKGRLDYLHTGGFLDLKTTGDVDAWAFTGLSARMMYHAQLAFYARGAGMTLERRIIAVEAKPPHDVAVFRLNGDAVVTGDQKVTELMSKLSVCLKRDEWPGQCADEQEMGIPSWMAEEPNAFGFTMGGESV